MKKLSINYNPYLLKTDISVDGIEIAANSSLQFGKQRLQEWSEKFVDIFLEEYKDASTTIEFTGSIADYNDLREAVEASSDRITVVEWKHNPIPEVEDVEKQISRIFEEIQNGPIDTLKGVCEDSFKQISNTQFCIKVFGGMAAGKTTLVNALLGRSLIPLANISTTPTIVRVMANDSDLFSAIARDDNDMVIAKEDDVTSDTIKAWSNDDRISTIDICGPILSMKDIGISIVLVDTTGLCRIGFESRKRVYEMLESSENSLVLFVVNETAMGADGASALEYVSDCMKKGGKQSRDGYLFAATKLDTYSQPDDSISGYLNVCKENLESIGIINPNLFPTASLPCLQLREAEKYDDELEMFKRRVQRSDAFKFDKYYDYNHLPQSSRARLESKDNGFTEVELHTGIPSIEEAIRLYVSKYARTMKVKDLVDSFNQRLVEERTIVDFEKRLRNNREAIGQMANQISNIRQQIRAGEMANEYAALIDDIDVYATIKSEFNSLISDFRGQIDNVINRYKNDSKVLKKEAEKKVKKLRFQYKNLVDQIGNKINSIFTSSLKQTYDSIISRYRQKLSEFGYQTDDSMFDLKPVYLVKAHTNRLGRLFKKHVMIVEEGQFESEYVKTGEHKEKLTNWIWEPESWFAERYETVNDYEWKDVWRSNIVERVNMSQVVSEFFSDLYAELDKVSNEVLSNLQQETDRMKSLNNDVNKKLADKLNELQQSIDNQHRAEEDVKKQEAYLQWMNGIVQRINDLIYF